MTIPGQLSVTINNLTTGLLLRRHAQHNAGAPVAGFVTALHTFAECDGDENRTKALYIKRRAEALIAAERKRVADERKILVLGPPLRQR